MEHYDVAIVGLGAMGSAAAAHCAMRGARTIGFEQFELGHTRGSSAGRSRIIRKAYFEDVAYVPLLERAYYLWHELETRTRRRLLDFCGVLVIDRIDGTTSRGVLRAAAEHAISVQTFAAPDARERFAQFEIGDDDVAIFEPEAGVVFPERGNAAHLDVARAYGATLVPDAHVEGWERSGAAQRVALRDGRTVTASRVIVTAGPWLPQLLACAGLPLHVQRNVQYWFRPRCANFTPDLAPAFFIERPEMPAPLYGMPDMGDGLKVALHGYGATTSADQLERTVSESEVREMRAILATAIPHAADALVSTKACMYTMTPDGHFAVGADPCDPHVIIAGGFSGHGYKFAPVIGEVLAQLALDGGTSFEVGFLDLRRLIPRSH